MTASLTASLVLKGDASGIVGAANEGAASLDRLKTSAAGAGAAGAGMAAPYNAAAVAIAGQATAADNAAKALTASGAAKVDEIARLTQLASASSATTASITALSAAHSQYNSAVNAARTLLAAGAISQADYEKAVAAASAQLALSKVVHDDTTKSLVNETGGAAALRAAQVELGETAEEGAAHIGHMGLALERLGAASGIGMVSARTLEESFRGLEGAVSYLGPVGTAVLGIVAAFATLIAAAASYESAQTKLDQVIAASGNQLGLTHDQYVSLAGDIANVTGETEKSSLAMAETLAQASITASAWTSLAQAASEYAKATGTDVASALGKFSEAEKDPASGAAELAEQIGILSAAQVEAIEHMEEMGNLDGAQKQLADDIRDHYKGAADNTSIWAGALGDLSDKISNAWTWLGKLATTPLPSWLDGVQAPAGLTIPQTPEQQAASANTEQQNELSMQAANMMAGIDTKGHAAEMAQNLKDQGDAYRLLNAGMLTYDQYSRVIAADDQKQLGMLGELTQSKGKLDAADQAHLDTIKHLISAGPEQISLAQADVAALQAEANASDGTAESIKNLQDQYDVQKKIQPYITALTQLNQLHAKGVVNQADYTKMAASLNSTMQQITASAKAEIAAQEQLNAMQTIASKFQGMSSIHDSNIAQPTTDSAFIANTSTQIFNANAAALTEWVNQTRTAIDNWLVYNSDGSEQALQKWQTFRDQLGLIFNSDMAKFYQDDLARRTDWASGVQRGLDQLTSETANWAKTSQDLVTGLSSHFEDDLAQMVVTGQNTLQEFFTWFAEQLVKMMYQEYMATSMNSMFSWIVGGLGDMMGAGAGAGAGAAGGNGLGLGMHDGGIVGRDASFVRALPMSLFDGAPRYHSGGYIGPGEVPIIAQEGERILSIAQTNAYDSAMSRPIVLQMPASLNDRAPVEVNIHPAPGTTATAQKRRNSDGSFSIDVMVEQIDRSLAQRSRKGRSAFVQSLENTHGIKRTPIG